MRYGAGDDRTRGRHSGRHYRGDESGQGSHAWNMPSGTDMYDGVSGRQARTSTDCHSQAPTSPWINNIPEELGGNADVTIWNPIEHRIELFHADTGIPATANRGDIVD